MNGRNGEGRGSGFRGADGDRIAGGFLIVEGDDDFLVGIRGEVQADVIGGNGEAVVPAVDEDGEFDFGGTAVVEQFIERGFDGAARKKHIVDEDDRGAIYVGGEDGWGELFRYGVAADIVAVKGDVEDARFRAELSGEATGQGDAAIGDAEEQQFAVSRVPGRDGFGEGRDGGVNFVGTDDFGGSHGEG